MPLPRFLLIAAALLLAVPAWGADAMPHFHPDAADPRRKISAVLLPLVEKNAAAPTATLKSVAVPAARPDAISVRLDVAVTAANLAAITATGATIRSTAARWNTVNVEATPAQLDALAEIPAVAAVVLNRKPRHRAIVAQPGTYQNQADGIMNAVQVRALLGTDGAGRTVGIISDSIHDSAAVGRGSGGGAPPFTLTGTTPQLAANLPAAIKVVADSAGGGSDEGAAMMEEFHHLAPGAACAFATAGRTETDMAANINSLSASAGATVICDDIGFFSEPMFQDGPIAQAAAAFVDAGGIYLSAAGNSGDLGIRATYADVSPATDPRGGAFPDGSDFHDWGIGGAHPGFLPLDINGAVTITLEWNQPYHSYGLGAGAYTDFDLYLFSAPASNLTNFIDAGGDAQGTPANPSGDPVEVMQDSFSGQRVYLALDFFAGLSSADFRIVFDTNGSVTCPIPGILGKATIYGHPAAAQVIAVAAAPVSAPTTVESFSSLGGVGANALPFYFDSHGDPLSISGIPQLRAKPDLTAPDGVATSLHSFSPFFGTSAATPNAAAAAVLAWTAQPTLTNAQIIAKLAATAIDLTAAPAANGVDARTGAGMVNAFLAAGGSPVPVITSTLAASTQQNQNFTYAITATNSPTAYAAANLPPGLAVSASTGVITGFPSAIGTTTIALSATNADGTGTANLVLNVHLPPPIFVTIPGTTVDLGQTYTATVLATNSATYALTTAPNGMTIDANTGAITWTPTASGTAAVTVTATNGTPPNATQGFVITVRQAPAITSAPLTTVGTGQQYAYHVTATGSPAPTFSLTTFPAGMAINAGSGLITWTTAAATSATVAVTASNGVGADATQTWLLTVFPQPTITSTPVTTAVVGQPYAYTVTAAGTAPSFALAAAPTGMAINAASGQITWTPQTSGTASVTVTASDIGPVQSQSYTITINQTPDITSTPGTAAVVGHTYTYAPTATGAPVPGFAITTGPPGMTVTNGVITWTPTTPVPATVTITASNGVDPAATQTWTIGVAQAPAITSPALTTATVGHAYSYALTATGHPAPTFQLVSGPVGMSVDAVTGQVSWTPATTTTANVTVTASNGIDPHATQSFAITVAPAPVAPHINPPPTATANAVINQSYSYTVTATGLPAPTFALTGAPVGMAINASTGILTWTPSTVGTFTFTVTASNGTAPDDSLAFTVVVVAAPGGTGSAVVPAGGGGGGSSCGLGGGLGVWFGLLALAFARRRPKA